MAEIVEYRVEKTIDELNLLIEFGLFTEQQAKQILAKRQNFEYTLRRRIKSTNSKLDFLKYIRFELNLLESIEKYRTSVIKDYFARKKSRTDEDEDADDETDHKILLLQAKKLADVVRSRAAHVSSLYRKLTYSSKFDKQLWLAYIDFSKSRKWTSKTSALYWKLLRYQGSDESIWLAAAEYELSTNKAFDSARGLYLRALRNFPTSARIWADYFKMEVSYMSLIEQRSRVIFKCTQKDAEKDDKQEDIWAEKELDITTVGEDDGDNDNDDADGVADTSGTDEADIQIENRPIAELVSNDDAIVSGKLLKTVYHNAIKAIQKANELQRFIFIIVDFLFNSCENIKGAEELVDYILIDLKNLACNGDARISPELASKLEDRTNLRNYIEECINDTSESSPSKRRKDKQKSLMDTLYECYENKGIEATREMFTGFLKSVKNQKLSLYVGMIQVEMWMLARDKSEEQLNRIRAIYEEAIRKFGKSKPKLWYELLRFEQENSKNLDDIQRVNQIYARAQKTLDYSKVDRVIEKYTLLQVNSSGADVEYSDYSDLDD